MKILTVVSQFFHAEGRTDTTKLIVTLRDFSKARKKRLKAIRRETHQLLNVW